MKILFVSKCDFSNIPLGILTLSSVLKKEGYSCEYIDLKFECNYLRKIEEIKPDIIGFSVNSFTWKYYLEISKKIKKRIDFFSIFGGPHCSINPEILCEDGIDAICIGEGEGAIKELATRFENKLDIRGIKNLWVKQNGVIYKNDVRNLLSDLNDALIPDYQLVSKYPFYKNFDIYFTMTSRGCPYNCPYCINHFYRKIYEGKGRYVRRRTVDNVIDELLTVKRELGAKLILFNDDIFTLDKEWLEVFAPKYIEKINLPFEAYTRVNEIDENTVMLLHTMGCKGLHLGIESGNQKIRYELLKRKISDKQIIDTMALLRKYNIKIVAFNLLGLPGETIEKAFETLSLNAKCKVTYPVGFVFQPFPNIDLTKYCIDNNFYDGRTDFFSGDLTFGKCLINSKESRRQIERLRYLFILGVKFPVTIPLIRFMIRWPLDFFYRYFFYFSKAIMIIFFMGRPSVKPPIKHFFNYPFVFSYKQLNKILNF